MKCPQCTQTFATTDKFCSYCGYRFVSVGRVPEALPEISDGHSTVSSTLPERDGWAQGSMWKGLLLAFLILLMVLAVATWYVMRGAESQVFKTPAYQLPAVETPASMESTLSAKPPSSSIVPGLEDPVENPLESQQEPPVNQGLSGDRALIY